MLQLINLTLRRKRELDIKKLKLDLLISIFLIFLTFEYLNSKIKLELIALYLTLFP